MATTARRVHEPATIDRPPRDRKEATQLRPVVLCASCRVHEARYGFRDEDGLERPRTLCFECFRIAVLRRQSVAAGPAVAAGPVRIHNGGQMRLPLAETLEGVDLRRRRAQIAARKALGI